jgi:hypothetical protein
MSDEQLNFKVRDRRLFNPDGSPRELSAEEKADQKAGETTETAGILGASRGETRSADTTKSGPAGTPPGVAEDETAPEADDPASFVNFIMSIASNAAAALGMMEHPVTHQREADLELGKHWIDVLGMLQQKTRGNLAPQEQQILEGLLADLRMQYVSLANSGPPRASRAYSGRDITGG